MPGPGDPEDEMVRGRLEVRKGTAYLWLGAFSKAEESFERALELEDSFDVDDKRKVKEDLERVKKAKAALVSKENADKVARSAPSSSEKASEVLTSALSIYNEAANVDQESSVIYANRCFANLRAGNLEKCLEDSDTALDCLKRWPSARQPPKKPARPTRLDPPMIDDPTFKHPDQQKQGEIDWLMKHNGGSTKDLPGLPDDYEWVRDPDEKSDTAWIAVKKKMSQARIDLIRRATRDLQDAMYLRKAKAIQQQLKISIDENIKGEGPSNTAIRQAQEYAAKLEEHDKEQEAEREKIEAELQQEYADCDLERNLTLVRGGTAQTGFGSLHPVEGTRRRLYIKVLLRRAKAQELLGDLESSAETLRTVLRVEPANPEAKSRLTSFTLAAPELVDSEPTAAATAQNESVPVLQSGSDASAPSKPARIRRDDELDSDEEDTGKKVDHASTAALLTSAAEYMKKNDYASALQIYNYARNTTKEWETPLVELKVLSNTSLCLQRIRGRLPELVAACNEAINRIEDLREGGGSADASEEMLIRMECACLSRRGSAYAQQRKTEESDRDAARVRELLARVEEVEAKQRQA